MSNQLFASSLQKVVALVAIAAFSSLSALPAAAKSCPGEANKTTKAVSQTVNTSASSVVVPVVNQPTASAETKATTTGTIVDIAASNGSFKTLVAAVKAAGLVEVLSGKGPFTVFAPTDAAFAALPKGTVEALLKPENKAKLQQILTYHVVPGSVMSTAIKPGQVNTVEGKPVTLSTKGNKIMVNNANVTAADIKASNGVIHVIDKVILPPGL